MEFPTAIWAGPTALSAKLAAAIALSIAFLSIVDHRRAPWLIQWILASAATFCCVWTVTNSTGAYRSAWIGAAILAAILAILMLRRWATLRPTQKYEEEVVANRLSGKVPPRKSAGSTSTASAAAFDNPMSWIVPQASLAVAMNVLLQFAFWTSIYQGDRLRATCIAHNLAITVALAICIAAATELTFISVPQANLAVNWKWLSWVAIGSWAIDLFCVLPTLFWIDDPQRDLRETTVGVVFSLCMVLIFMIVWLIPHRLGRNPKGQTATDWVSLAITAWIATLCLIVVELLPYRWPWILG